VRQLKVYVQRLLDAYRVSVHRACGVVQLHRSAWYYQTHRREDKPLRQRIREIAATRIRYGMWRIYVLLRREGFTDNHKRVHRIYKEEGLNLRSKRPRRNKAAAHRLERPENNQINHCWSMDFVQDNLFDGRKFRCLTIVDNCSRYCQAISIAKSIKGIDVVEVMEALKMQTKVVPERIQVDNGSEFISKDFDKWAYENKVTLDYSRPGKPTDNPFIESFNGSFRDECLNTHWFLSLEDAYEKINAWVKDYNHFRPHSSLGQMTPVEFIYNHTPMESREQSLPAAPLPKARYFAAEEFTSTATENTYLSEALIIPSNSPKSPT
jgi:putative transposase